MILIPIANVGGDGKSIRFLFVRKMNEPIFLHITICIIYFRKFVVHSCQSFVSERH